MTVLATTVSGTASRAMALALACLLGLLGLTTASTARADEPGTTEDPEPEVSDQARLWNRLLAVELQGAIDGPLGVVGGTIVISPLTNLALEVGGGASRDGGRVAGGLRVMLPQDHFALMLRLGVEGGPLSWDGSQQSGASTSYTGRRQWAFSAGMYADVGLQYRFDMGLYLGLNAGVETAFSPVADSCSVVETGPDYPTTCARDGYRPTRIYIGLLVGYAFDIVL
ncbi:MAG: hypothetical protein K1X94_30640 [Sandaracinaceae bacterium]|nr:hypothetical protein [Sandaracinaceae bacterium]